MDIAEILREFGGLIGVATLLASIFIFIFTRGKQRALNVLITENNKALLEQNKLLRQDMKDRSDRFDIALQAAHDEKKDLLNKLSLSVQERISLSERLSTLEGMVKDTGSTSFRTFMEDAVKHFTLSSQTNDERQIKVVEALEKINTQEDETVKVLGEISTNLSILGKGLQAVVDFLEIHNGNSIKKKKWDGKKERRKQV